MPYGPNLTNKFAIPHVCLYHVSVPTVHSCPNELYNIHGDTYATIKVNVQSEHEPYQSNGDTYRTSYITYPPVPSVQNVLLGILSNLKNCHFGIKVAESAIPRRIFWILWKMAYTLTRETEMTVAGMCSSSPWNWGRRKKREKKEEEEEDIASFKNYLRMDSDTFNEILPFWYFFVGIFPWCTWWCTWWWSEWRIRNFFDSFIQTLRPSGPQIVRIARIVRVVCFTIRIVCIALRFVRIPVRDDMHRFVCHMNCTADSACPAYESSQYIRCWYICFGLQFGWCVNVIRTVWMSNIHYGPCV